MNGFTGFNGGLYNATSSSSYPHTLAGQSTRPPSDTTPSSGGSTSSSPPLAASAPATADATSLRRVGGKSNVSSACGPCKRAHLACDVGRPCKRCINVGKEDMCEDVPHKKRGRPKAPKDMSGPFSRMRPSLSNSDDEGKWRDPWRKLETHDASKQPLVQSLPQTQQTRPNLPLTSSPMPPIFPLPTPPLFTLFTTTDLRILRCTSDAYPLTGHSPQDFLNTSLLDWVIPPDRQLLEMEHGRLMNNPMSPEPLHTNHETQEAIAHREEKDLVSPVDGMREPYPNQNVRLMRSDQQYSLFNVRLHLGGGLGGSLWHPDTLGKVYFVISLLLLSPPSAPLPPHPSLARASLSAPAILPLRHGASFGGSDPAPTSAEPRRHSYLPTSYLPSEPHPIYSPSSHPAGPRDSTGASDPTHDAPPSAAPLSQFEPPPSGTPVYYSTPVHTPLTYPNPSPLISPHLASLSISQSYSLPPALYPAARSPTTEPQLSYAIGPGRDDGGTFYGQHTSSTHSYHPYPTHVQSTMQHGQGYHDPRLVQAQWNPEANVRRWGRDEVMVKTELEDGPIYTGDAQAHMQVRSSSDAGPTSQNRSQAYDQRPSTGGIEVGGGYKGYVGGV